MDSEQQDQLRGLREQVLGELTNLSDFIVDDPDTSYELLLVLARTTDNPKLLQKALDKIKKIEDKKEKSDALLDLLDEVEAYMTPPTPVDQAQPENSDTNQSQ